MPAFKNVFIQKKLEPLELEQLASKGYLKLRIELTLEHLRLFQSEYRVGDKFDFHSESGDNLKTSITSIDTGEPHDDIYRVFIGFALL